MIFELVDEFHHGGGRSGWDGQQRHSRKEEPASHGALKARSGSIGDPASDRQRQIAKVPSSEIVDKRI